MKYIILGLMIVSLTACQGKAEESNTTGDFQVERLFTHEGCTSYRYYDGGRYIHYTTCGVTSTSTYSCGKNCTQSDEVTTN